MLQGWKNRELRGHGLHPPLHSPIILRCKKEKREKQRKKDSFKAETIKRLSPMPKCHCFSHSRASRIQKKFLSPNHGSRQYFSVFYGPYALKSVFSALPVLVRNYRENSVFVSIKFSRVFDYFNHLELLFVPKKLWSSHQTSATDLLYLTWKIYMSIKSIFVWM